MTDLSQVTVREGEVEETRCTCCGAPTTVVTGYLEAGELSAGWYTVGATRGAPGHLPLLRLYIGDWTEGAAPAERWGLRIGISPEGPQLLAWPKDASGEARLVFTPLDPEQVLDTPLEAQVWALTDTILTGDSRL